MLIATENKRQMRAHVLERAPLSGPGAPLQAAMILAALLLGLLLDAQGSMVSQLLASAMVWALLLWLLSRQTRAWRLTLVACTAFALLAEIVFSLGFGLYDYRFHNVPPYVPPGHTLLFMLGLAASRQVPDTAVKPLALLIATGGLLLTLTEISSLDGLMLAAFLFAWALGHQRKTYVLMVLMALILELLGTSFGNWRWSPQVPALGLTAHNPPLLAGACYALYDMAVMGGSRVVHRLMGDAPPASACSEEPRSAAHSGREIAN
jgi:hypothetical protein